MAIDFPNSPSVGDTYITNGKQYRWDGTAWGIYGTFSPDSTASDTEPSGVGDGHIWYRSDQSQTLIRYDNTWVEVGSAGGFNSSSTSFPASLDSGTGFAAVEALQAKVGVDSSAVTSSLDYKIATLENAPTGRRNLLYNGAMQIAQRATSASYGSSGNVIYHTADRWKTYANGTGSFTQSIENDGPAGFAKSLKILCTASATLTTGEGKYFAQELEGQDLQHLAYGTASAKTMTFSFWVKSNVVTDNHTVVFHYKDGTYTYLLSKTYSVSSADTWEYKTITVPGSTTFPAILNNTTAYGMSIRFWLSAGTNYTGSGVTNSNWIQWTDNEDIAPFYDQDISTSGDYWQVTGLQLEVGDKATPFEHRSYGEELALCQRYYEKTYSDNVTPGSVVNQGSVYNASASNAYSDMCYNVEFSVSKRVPPTMTFYQVGGTQGTWDYQRSGVSSTSTPVWSGTWAGTHGGLLYQPVGAAYTAAFHYGHWVAEAEL